MISNIIAELRYKHNMSQTDLAKKLNITRSSINAWELGISVPSTSKIVELSKIFKVSTDYLLLGDKPNKMVSLEGLTLEEEQLVLNLIDILSSKHET